MKKIVLQIEDEIFANLESELVCKRITGNLFGPLDEFAVLLVKAIKAGQKDVVIIKKKRKRKQAKQLAKKE